MDNLRDPQGMADEKAKPEGAIMKTILAQDVARPLEDLFYEIGFTEGEWLVIVEKVKNDD